MLQHGNFVYRQALHAMSGCVDQRHIVKLTFLKNIMKENDNKE
jgi:hypothetical protein